jgi:hypothetical protein
MCVNFDNYYVKQIFQLYESQYAYSGLLLNHFVFYEVKFYCIIFVFVCLSMTLYRQSNAGVFM